MRMTGDSPLWTKNIEEGTTYPPLSQDIKTDIVIVGGGTTGALTAHYFMKQGLNCVLVEKNQIAHHGEFHYRLHSFEILCPVIVSD